MTNYLLGLATLPALVALWAAVSVALGLSVRFLRDRGLWIERGGPEVGEQYEYSFSSRSVRRYLRVFWVGRFINRGVSDSRFLKVATSKRAFITIAHVRHLDRTQP